MTYEQLDDLGRVRLSKNFFMRDFLYSEIACFHGLQNIPENPDAAIEVGRQLCVELLEPLQATFGRIAVRSGYRSPAVNDFGNRNKLNCASNEANYAAHIWDYADAHRRRGATACIVVPWLVDHIANGGCWTDMAWWIHDHLPYSTLCFFSKLAAFNISWHERPVRRIDSFAAPKGCLTRPGLPNHEGPHRDLYLGLPPLASRSTEASGSGGSHPRRETPHSVLPALSPAEWSVRPPVNSRPSRADAPASEAAATQPVRYRAIHTKTTWRTVDSHRSLQAALHGKDGAAALFAGKARIDYDKHGDPLFVLAWEQGASEGFAARPGASAGVGVELVRVPIRFLENFERRRQASQRELQGLFVADGAK